MHTLLNNHLIQHGVFSELLSNIDESMVPYYERHNRKMFIRDKSIRFGYKLWYVCDSNGHPYHIISYQDEGKAAYSSPLGTRAVDSLMQVIRTSHNVTQDELLFHN